MYSVLNCNETDLFQGLLTPYPNVLQRVREEISAVLGKGPETNVEITYEGHHKLTSLSCVLKEGQ